MPQPFEVNAMLADTFEPKRQNRFLFQFTDDTLPAYIARTASRPSFTQETVTIDYLNSKRYLAGKFEWNTPKSKFCSFNGTAFHSCESKRPVA